MAFFYWIWNLIRSLGSIIFPIFTRVGAGMGNVLRWVLHALLVLIVLVLLWYLNGLFDLERALRSNFPALHPFWLPLLFLLLYFLCWFGYWLYKLLGPERITSDFPDIDEAWAEAMQALAQASIDVTEVPLFLVLGSPAQSETGLFNAARIPFSVRQTPMRANAPLHVYAHRDGIYVSVPGASLLAKQAELFSTEPQYQPEPASFAPAYVPPSETAPSTSPSDEIQAIVAKAEQEGRGPDQLTDDEKRKIAELAGAQAPSAETTKKIQEIVANAEKQGRGPNELTDDEKKQISDLATADAAPVGPREPEAAPQPQPQPAPATIEALPPETERRKPLLKNKEQIDAITARLQYVCKHIARERRPFCSVNGVLLLIPYAATETDTEASHVAGLCQADIRAAREILQVDCPMFVMVCDMEQAPGFHELVARLPEAQRYRTLGQRFPLVPDVDPPEIASMIEDGMRWVCEGNLPAKVFPMLQLEGNSAAESGGDPNSTLLGNARLFQFLSQMRERQHRLSRLIYRGTMAGAEGPPMVGGCYFAGTGADAQRDQAFVAEVFYEMLRSQNFVSWTGQALADEARYRLCIRLGIAGFVFLFVAIIGVGYFLWTE